MVDIAVNATSFIYDEICSEDFGLYIGEINGQSLKEDMASTNVELVMDSVVGRSENFIYGVKQSKNNLEFTIGLYGSSIFSKNDILYIDNWLFANKTPKKLIFCQQDMANYYFNAIFSKNDIIYHGNVAIGFRCTIVCDSPYAYEAPKSETYDVINGKSQRIRFNNLNGGINYLYPSIEFVCNSDNGSVSIKNITDNNRNFIINGLQKNEKITISKWLELNSSTGLRRLGNCNKQWLRFKNGINEFEIIGNTDKLKITYQFNNAIGS